MKQPPTIERSRREWEAGRRWRAKEILQGAVRTQGYHPDLYEEYGRVLLDMGDTLEAGKYLFLSGARTPEYAQPIQLYLARHAKNGATQLRSTFPAAARTFSPRQLPATILEDLATHGIDQWEPLSPIQRPEHSKKETIFLLILTLLIIAIFIIGLVSIISFTVGWFL